MPTVLIPMTIKEAIPNENVMRDLCWHDPIRGELLWFQGGRLEMEYREDEYLVEMGEAERKRRNITSTSRLLPKVVDVKVRNYKNPIKISNRSAIVKWFDEYLNYNHSTASVANFTADGIEFNVQDDELEDFVYQAERGGFRAEI